MSDPLILEVAGLQLSNSTFSASPPGSLSIADNIVITQKGVAQPRNGQKLFAFIANGFPFQLTEFQSFILFNSASSLTDTGYTLGYVDAGGTQHNYSGDYPPVDDDGVTTFFRMRFAQAALFLHFCTQGGMGTLAGPKLLEAYNGTVRASGLTRVPDIAVLTGFDLLNPSGFLAYNTAVAYRAVHKKVTSSGQVNLSPQTSRLIATNRIVAPIGGLVRTGGNLVTATITPGAKIYGSIPLPVQTGQTVTLTPGEANFATGNYVITGVPTANTFTWASAGANVSSTVAQEINPGVLFTEIVVGLPKDALAGDSIQVYRSLATTSSTIEPGDDLFQVAEHLISAADIVGGNVVIEDRTPQSVLSNPLYTNPTTGDGATAANYQPPIYRDVSNFDGQTWYANTTGQHTLNLEMLGVGAPNGIQDGDTITISDLAAGGSVNKTYTFKNAPAAGQIQIISDGTPSFNIAWTTYAAVVTIAADLLSSGIGFYGNSSPTSLPGKFTIQRQDFGPQFSVKVSRPKSWSPALDSVTPTYSDNNRQPNGLWNSKAAQPESVPSVNFRNIGAANFNIRRILGLKNALLIFKEGDGIWSLSGTAPYNLQQISTANIIAPDCCALFADCAWVYTDQGILRVTDAGGAQVVSRPIETLLNNFQLQLPALTHQWSFAVPYETDRRIMFYVPTASTSPETSLLPQMEAFNYSLATNSWTRVNHHCVSGIVSSGHLLYTGVGSRPINGGSIPFVTQERKTGTYFDFADADWQTFITSVGSSSTVSVLNAVPAGSGISQVIGGVTWFTKVTSASADGKTLQLAEAVPFTSDTCIIYDPYPVNIQFLPAGNPSARKMISRLQLLWKPQAFANYFGSTTLFTDEIQDVLQIPTPSLGFGLTPFGTGPFGNPPLMTVNVNPIAAQWANAAQFFPGYSTNEVWAPFKLQGIGMRLETSDAPSNRSK